MRPVVRSIALLSAALLVLTTAASTQRGESTLSASRQVRQLLGHGDVAGARRLAESTSAGAERELALALVEIFVGQYDAAAVRLQPLAARAPVSEPALELGLLELLRGQREAGRRRLAPLVAVRTFSSPDDYFRLARAAIGSGEFLLANDAFQRVAKAPRADIHTAWGDLFMRYRQPAEAVTSYRDALTADPAWVPAFVGLARAFGRDDPEAAEAAFEAARKIAPAHPDVLLLAAERALEEDDEAAAGRVLDQLATVRSGSLDEAAWRVALAYDRGGIAAVEPAIAAVRAADPRSALGYRLAADRAAQAYRSFDALAFARRAVEVDPDDAEAHLAVGLYSLRTGKEDDGRRALERSWEINKSVGVTKNLLDLLDTLDTFVVVETPAITFKFDPREAEVLKVYAVPLAQEAFDTFVKRYGFTPKNKILLEVFSRHDDFAVRTLGLPGLVGALGACFGEVVTMDSPAARPPGQFSWQATLWHEMAHVFTLQMSDYRVPRWLTEGISQYEEHRRVPAWGRELTLEYGRALATKQNFGVKGLPEAFKRPESLSMAYFEASLVVEHLVELRGDAGLRTFLQAYAAGATDVEAFAKAFGQSIDQIDVSFAAFVDRRYSTLRAAMAPAPRASPDDLAALRARAAATPGNFVSQWELGRALFESGDVAAARVALERAASLAPQASGDQSPRAILAAIAEREGDIARARREYRALLGADHVNVAAARRFLAIAKDDVADQDMALRLIADLDPFDKTVHGQLGRRLLSQNKFADALLEFKAALALGPPNKAEAHADVAETLLKLGRRDEAKRAALEALKEAPTFPRAQDLLLEAIGRVIP